MPTINQARTLANINDRAQRITEDYRLIWNRREGCFMVAHKEDRSRRYTVTVTSCSCPSFENHRTCKHFLGLPVLAEVEIQRYTLLGFNEDRARVEAFKEDLDNAAHWNVICAEVEERAWDDDIAHRM